MLDRLKALIGGPGRLAAGGAPPGDRLQLAAACLLVEAARMADHIAPEERDRVVQLLRWRFDLDQADAELLVAEAERETEGPAPWHAYTATIRDAFGPAERIQLIELLWEIVYADGTAHHMEENLMRRIAGLLHVDDRDSGLARQRVRARLGL